MVAASVVLLPSIGVGAQAPSAPYRDRSLSIDARVRDLLGRMTLEEKFWQLFMIPGDLDDPSNDYSNGVFGLQISSKPAADGNAARAHAERINAIQRYFVERTRLGIPIIPFEEALHGLGRDGATVVPASDRPCGDVRHGAHGARRAGDGTRSGSRGIRQVLSPVINLATDVRWGRVEETYGEDPVLTSRMGVAFVSAFESAGIIATPKHFIANVGEGGRDSYPIDFSKRLLEEMYYPPFEAAISQGHARSVMSAYNSVDGSPATQNRGVADRQAEARLGFSRLRDLRRGGDRRRDRAASHRSDDGHGDEGRARRRTRRDLSIVVAAASAVSRRLSPRRNRRFGDRRRGDARAAREVRARTVRASVRESRQRGVLERPRRSSHAWRARRRANRSCC